MKNITVSSVTFGLVLCLTIFLPLTTFAGLPAWIERRAFRLKPYDIRIRYPYLKKLRATQARRRINQAIRQHIAQLRKRLIGGRLKEFARPNYMMHIDYRTFLASSKLLSVLFTISTYTGGAHPNSGFSSLCFDLDSGAPLSLPDLFRKGTPWLKTISRHAISALQRQKWQTGNPPPDIEAGAGPAARNFCFFALTGKGLLLAFPPYQVGPYVEGPRQVVVPFIVLQEMFSRRVRHLLEQ